MTVSRKTVVSKKIQALLSNYLPTSIKAYIKSKQVKILSSTTIAYRITLAEKIITMYKTDSNKIKVDY